jgi:coenzyme F420-reducing hydrogenase beta subunit
MRRATAGLPVLPIERLAPREVVDSGLCLGCGSCVAQAGPGEAAMRMDRQGHLRPEGTIAWWRSRSAALARTCPASPYASHETQLAAELFPGARRSDPGTGRLRGAWVGHVAQGTWREQGSSGGLVSWVAGQLIERGWVDGVAHVVPAVQPQSDGRFFRYRISRSVGELREGARSRYYPVEMAGVLDEIRRRPGRYAVVGIPCFIKAVQLLRREDPLFRERIVFTLGLFCGHMKSARFTESFAHQLGVDLRQVRQVEYRHKDAGRPANWYRVQFTLHDGSHRAQDWFHLAEGDWGSGFFQNGACNFCDDVMAETADISFGDAWVEPYASDGRGTNVVVARSQLLAGLVTQGMVSGALALEDVEADFVSRTQAAGLRQRREGLAYRLTWRHAGIQPRKRVQADAGNLPWRRKLVYRLRAHLTAWSNRLWPLAVHLGLQRLYVAWAWRALAVYQGATYSRGRVGRWLDKVTRGGTVG